MRTILFCAFALTLLIVIPIAVAFGLWFKDRKDEERKGYWDPE
jgi:hypothetical protein